MLSLILGRERGRERERERERVSEAVGVVPYTPRRACAAPVSRPRAPSVRVPGRGYNLFDPPLQGLALLRTVVEPVAG